MYVFTENGGLVNLDSIKTIQVKPYANTYGVIADDRCLLCRCNSANEAHLVVQYLANAIECCTRVYYLGEKVLPF